MQSSGVSDGSQVTAVIRLASQRRLLVLAVEQVGFALAIVFAGGILMLLLGTQILDWYWLTLLGLTALAVSIVRIHRCLLSRYRIAQILDSRFQLSDSLSTAFFLLTEVDRRNHSIAQLQLGQAEQNAALVKPAAAFPFGTRRAWKIAGALGAIAGGLFAFRYLVQSRLSFEQSLIPIHLGPVLERLEQSLSSEDQAEAYPSATAGDPSARKRSQSQQIYESRESSSLQDPSFEEQLNSTSSKESAAQNTRQENGKVQGGESEKTASNDSSQQRNPGDDASPDTQERTNTPRQNTKEQLPGDQQSSSSLLEKMKEAASSLLAKMRSTSAPQTTTRNGERSPDVTRTEEQAAAKNGQQSASSNAQKQAPGNSSSDGAEQGQTRERAEASEGRNSDQSPDKNGSDAHSGIGRQDGDKASREAEQLQAMGKLAEIIGKRSADLTGEVTVETSSGKQQLKTQFSQRLGRHSDSGGEINHDDIPLIYQQYVREYMERIHKHDKTSR